MKILNNDEILNNFDNGLSNINCSCGCTFSATEDDIELQVIPIVYKTGIKGFLKMPQKYIHNRYITCPSCFKKMRVKFCIEDDYKDIANIKEGKK